MQYTRLGNTGLIISRLGFGAMTFGSALDSPMAHVFNTPEKTADALVGRSLEVGINFFDTADAYANGQSEQILGKALKPRRAEVIISTKVGFRSAQAVIRAGASYGHVIAAAEASLKRLGTDYIDLLSIHRLDPYTPLEETVRALDNLVQRGLVRYVGYSNFSAWQSAKCVGIQERHNYARFVAAQMYYSLVGRDIEYEIAPFCADAGIGIVVWSPLAGGFLTGRYTRQDPAGGSGRLASGDFLPLDRERAWDVIDRMRAIGERHRASIAQVALAWLLAKPFVSTILLGASKMSQLEDNLGAVNVELSAAEVAELDRLTEPAALYPNWFHTRTADQVSAQALGLAPEPEQRKPAAD
jgi:aryl-alcohol dehydrogenase-like predicted oxidoreductase